jgi:hypothetical protein
LIAFAAFSVAGQPNVTELSARVDSGDAAAFQQVLALAQTTPPGESLEDLAEISSHFVRVNPTGVPAGPDSRQALLRRFLHGSRLRRRSGGTGA